MVAAYDYVSGYLSSTKSLEDVRKTETFFCKVQLESC